MLQLSIARKNSPSIQCSVTTCHPLRAKCKHSSTSHSIVRASLMNALQNDLLYTVAKHSPGFQLNFPQGTVSCCIAECKLTQCADHYVVICNMITNNVAIKSGLTASIYS